MLAWLPAIITLIGAAGGVLTPQIQAFLVAHPQLATLVAAVWAIFNLVLPPPIVPSKDE